MNALAVAPEVKPAPHKKLESRQSKYSELPTLPLRGIVLAPSGGGGSTLLQWFILTGYRGLFERIHVISPSIYVDSETWDPVKRYIYGEMGTPKGETCLHADWDAQFVENLLVESLEITQDQKRKGRFHTPPCIDDLATRSGVMKPTKL